MVHYNEDGKAMRKFKYSMTDAEGNKFNFSQTERFYQTWNKKEEDEDYGEDD